MTLSLRRERYQQGSLTKEKRNSGPDVWVYRWREQGGAGKTVQRKKIVGSVQQYKTETAARKSVDALKMEINAQSVSTSPIVLQELAEHYREKELGDGCGKTKLTREVYSHHLDSYILPRWGKERIGDIKALPAGAWLGSLEKSDCNSSALGAGNTDRRPTSRLAVVPFRYRACSQIGGASWLNY